MTRLAIDAGTLIRLVESGGPLGPGHALVARGSLRSDAMALLYRDVVAGRRTEAQAKALLEGVTGVTVRLLGDRVSRATAWRIARELGRDEIGDAEHLALARLQADALATEDPDLRAAAAGLVALAPFADLLR